MSRHARIEVRPIGGQCNGEHQMYADGWYCSLHGHECPRLGPMSNWAHYLRLVAANGQVLATSETYANRRNARRAVQTWKYAFADVVDPFDRREDDTYYRSNVVEFDADGNEVTR